MIDYVESQLDIITYQSDSPINENIQKHALKVTKEYNAPGGPNV